MRLARAGGVSAAAFVFGLLAASLAFAKTWSNVSVIDVQGWRFEAVSVEVTADSQDLKLTNPTGGYRFLPVARVRVIRDAEGRDITREVLAAAASAAQLQPPEAERSTAPESQQAATASPPPEPQEALSASRSQESVGGTSPTAPEVRPSEAGTNERRTVPAPATRGRPALLYGPRFRVELGGFLGVGSPNGDWPNLDSGLYAGTRVRWAIADHIFVGAAVSRQGLGSGAHLVEAYLVGGAMTRSSNPKAPVAHCEMGFGSASRDVPEDTEIDEFGYAYSTPGMSSGTDLSMLLGVGVIVPISRTAGLDIDGDLRVTGEETLTGAVLGTSIGIAFLLGK